MPKQRTMARQHAARGLRLLLVTAALHGARAHEHHGEDIPEGHTTSSDPIDTVLWVHIFLQMLAFGVTYPVGMVLGLVKSRWHVPVQVLSTALAILGYFLGHMHGGRQFRPNNAHAGFATPLFLILAAQVAIGIYLKLHLEKGLNARIRRIVKPVHSFLGKAFPVLSWTQLVLGGITALGFCQENHLGQCVAHFIMGGAFVAYGIVLTIVLVAGQVWVQRSGRSQEFYDSAVIAAWGCINTFTEHRWGEDWRGNDWQHTTMGVVWWCAGLAGIWLSRDGEGRPKRNFVPGFVLLITGWGMSAHPQSLEASAGVHAVFGYTLMAAGVSRIVEIAFVLRDSMGLSEDGRTINSFQYIPVFLLYASGFLFMGATDEQMELIAGSPMDHVSYILILYSFAFLMFLFAHMLIHLYDRSSSTESEGVIPDAREEDQLRDAEEFELDGLVSDEEDEGRRSKEVARGGVESGSSSEAARRGEYGV